MKQAVTTGCVAGITTAVTFYFLPIVLSVDPSGLSGFGTLVGSMGSAISEGLQATQTMMDNVYEWGGDILIWTCCIAIVLVVLMFVILFWDEHQNSKTNAS